MGEQLSEKEGEWFIPEHFMSLIMKLKLLKKGSLYLLALALKIFAWNKSCPWCIRILGLLWHELPSKAPKDFNKVFLNYLYTSYWVEGNGDVHSHCIGWAGTTCSLTHHVYGSYAGCRSILTTKTTWRIVVAVIWVVLAVCHCRNKSWAHFNYSLTKATSTSERYR